MDVDLLLLARLWDGGCGNLSPRAIYCASLQTGGGGGRQHCAHGGSRCCSPAASSSAPHPSFIRLDWQQQRRQCPGASPLQGPVVARVGGEWWECSSNYLPLGILTATNTNGKSLSKVPIGMKEWIKQWPKAKRRQKKGGGGEICLSLKTLERPRRLLSSCWKIWIVSLCRPPIQQTQCLMPVGNKEEKWIRRVWSPIAPPPPQAGLLCEPG